MKVPVKFLARKKRLRYDFYRTALTFTNFCRKHVDGDTQLLGACKLLPKWLAVILVPVISPSLSAAFIIDRGGGTTFDFGYSAVGSSYSVAGMTVPSVDVSTTTGLEEVIIRATGTTDVSRMSVSNTFGLATKLAVESPLDGVAYLKGSSAANFVVQIEPEDNALYVDGFGFGLMRTRFEWGILGYVAPGDRIEFSVGNGVFDQRGGVADWSGNGLGYEHSQVITEAGAFSFNYYFDSARWNTESHTALTQVAEFQFSIFSGAGSTERSWIGFSDPGTIGNIVAVPEPSGALLLLVGSVIFTRRIRLAVLPFRRVFRSKA